MVRSILLFILLLVIGFALFPTRTLEPNSIDTLIVHKSQRTLSLYHHGTLIETYTIALGKDPIGAKTYEGDHKTPEGNYTIDDKNPHSRWHKNLGISYPNHDDLARAHGRSAGGAIKIHGMRPPIAFIGRWHRYSDWTDGCIALTNDEMDQLYRAVPIGAVIHIVP